MRMTTNKKCISLWIAIKDHVSCLTLQEVLLHTTTGNWVRLHCGIVVIWCDDILYNDIFGVRWCGFSHQYYNIDVCNLKVASLSVSTTVCYWCFHICLCRCHQGALQHYCDQRLWFELIFYLSCFESVYFSCFILFCVILSCSESVYIASVAAAFISSYPLFLSSRTFIV